MGVVRNLLAAKRRLSQNALISIYIYKKISDYKRFKVNVSKTSLGIITTFNSVISCIIIIMMSTVREKKYKEVYQNATAFKSFAHFE